MITQAKILSHNWYDNGYQYNKTRFIAYLWCNVSFSYNTQNIPTNIFILDL